MPRGRLIFPFLVDVARLDTESTQADTTFREPKRIANLSVPGKPTSVSGRAELAIVRLRCQIEDDKFEALDEHAAGDSPVTSLTLVFHYRDLERAGFVDTNGEPLLRVRDRIAAIRDRRGNLVRTIRTPPGLYITEVKDGGHGLGLSRNLLIATCESRERAAQA